MASSAFEGTIRALLNGAGPRASVRAYLYTCVRNNEKLESEHKSRHVAVSDESEFGSYSAPFNSEVKEHWTFLAEAYKDLPERWRTALWYVCVEDMTPGEVGKYMDLSANAVSALVFRARAGLRQAYEAHDRRTAVQTAPAVVGTPTMTLSRDARTDYKSAPSLSKSQKPAMTLSLSKEPNSARTAAKLGMPRHNF